MDSELTDTLWLPSCIPTSSKLCLNVLLLVTIKTLIVFDFSYGFRVDRPELLKEDQLAIFVPSVLHYGNYSMTFLKQVSG